MRKTVSLGLLTLSMLLLGDISSMAQKPARNVTKPAADKKPLVKSWLGQTSGNVSMEAAAAGQLISQPLKVTDDKQVDYVISSYQLAYKRIGVTEDEETG